MRVSNCSWAAAVLPVAIWISVGWFFILALYIENRKVNQEWFKRAHVILHFKSCQQSDEPTLFNSHLSKQSSVSWYDKEEETVSFSSSVPLPVPFPVFFFSLSFAGIVRIYEKGFLSFCCFQSSSHFSSFNHFSITLFFHYLPLFVLHLNKKIKLWLTLSLSFVFFPILAPVEADLCDYISQTDAFLGQMIKFMQVVMSFIGHILESYMQVKFFHDIKSLRLISHLKERKI